MEKKLIDVTTVGERDLAKLHERYLLLDYHPEYTIRDFKEGAFGIARATYEVRVFKLVEEGEQQ